MLKMLSSRRCVPCAINYDVIIKFESLEADSQYLIDQCSLGDRLSVAHENPAPTGVRTEQVSSSSMLSVAHISILILIIIHFRVKRINPRK